MTARTLVFSSGTGQRQCLLRGLGLALLPRRAVREDVAAGRLVELDWPPAPAETMLLMISQAERWHSPLMRAFMALAHEMVAE